MNAPSAIVVAFLLVHLASAQVGDTITTSPTCIPYSHACITFSEALLSSSARLSITLLPGVHTLSSSIQVGNRARFSMAGTFGETFVNCTPPSRTYVRLNGISSMSISNITFTGCHFEIRESNNTDILQSAFVNGTSTSGALEFSSCSNITIDRSRFMNNQYRHDSYYYHYIPNDVGGVVEMIGSTGIAITHCNFSNNDIFSVLYAVRSEGYVSCCSFRNNSVQSHGGVVKSTTASRMVITNSSLIYNDVSSYGGIIYVDHSSVLAVISSVLQYNGASSYGGVVLSEGTTTILASDFSHNRAGQNGGAIKSSDPGGRISVDCTRFRNNSNPGNSGFSVPSGGLSVRISTSCWEQYAAGADGTCDSNDCVGICAWKLPG